MTDIICLIIFMEHGIMNKIEIQIAVRIEVVSHTNKMFSIEIRPPLNKRLVCKRANAVRPRDTRPQAARTSQVHVFELGPKEFEMNEFM